LLKIEGLSWIGTWKRGGVGERTAEIAIEWLRRVTRSDIEAGGNRSFDG
jgi:hypothetical protein